MALLEVSPRPNTKACLFSPHKLFSSLSPLIWVFLHCSLCTLLSLKFLFPSFLFKNKRTFFPPLSFCSRGCYPASNSAIRCNSESHLGVRSGHLVAQQKRPAVPSHGLLGSMSLVPARPCCEYGEAPAKLLCL